MRLHSNIVIGISTILKEIFFFNSYADKAVKYHLKKNKQWGARDRRLVAQVVYDIVRNKRYYTYLSCQKEVDLPVFYSTLIDVWLYKNNLKTDGVDKYLSKDNTPISFDIKQSIPKWLDNLGNRELKEKWQREIKYLNQPAPVCLRVNTLKCDKKYVLHKLSNDHIDTISIRGMENALYLKERKNITSHPLYKKGYIEIQDLGSQYIVPYLMNERENKNLVFIDACAGAGGKTLHAASIMHNKGHVIAMDTDLKRLKILEYRAKKAGVKNLDIQPISSVKDIDKYKNLADKLLIDAPCSGLGTLKRKPDLKWKLNPKAIQDMTCLQSHILDQYPSMAKKQGDIVYATCSILPSENEKQVKRLLQKKSNLSLIKQQTLFPSQTNLDGFYMALMSVCE